MGNRSLLRNRWAALGVVAMGAAAAAASVHFLGTNQSESSQAGAAGAGSDLPESAQDVGDQARDEQTYIIVYKERPLATYEGELPGLAAPARLQRKGGAGAATQRSARGRIDVKGAAARNYVRYLQGQHAVHEGRINASVGRKLSFRMRMQHAINGSVVHMTAAEAQRVAALNEVELVEPYREYKQVTDLGPGLINAPAVWSGGAGHSAYRGEGMVVGIIDSGINFGSPSFAATAQDGYSHTNPLGAGVYLGTCATGGADEGRCNDKLIGGYDFVCNFGTARHCTTSSSREEPGFGDTNSHGSHVASTAAGNPTKVRFNSSDFNISGVAPRANIVAYDACFTDVASGGGLCPNVSTLAAVNQAIADGVVDVINYSIGGGNSPWTESVSLAMLNATEAGIYVAAAAGNDGPDLDSASHFEPWTATTAASQTGRGGLSFFAQITGPGIVPEALRAIALTPGNSGVSATVAPLATTPLRMSAGIDGANDGCETLPVDFYKDSIALIRRGTCAFTQKVNNAASAGAIAVWIANNVEEDISPTVTDTTIPTFGLTKGVGDSIRDFITASAGTATATFTVPPTFLPNMKNSVANFSSRGGPGRFSLLKPDVTAPGVRILAVVAGNTLTGFENAVDLEDGTSMASPHHAGAAALVKQAKPEWSVQEVKSALMMTANDDITERDGARAADGYARGAGLIQVDKAIRAGLVLSETKENFLAANPATGGDVTALNLPSMANLSCGQSCTFTRVFRSTLTTRQSWSMKLQGVTGVVSPALITLGPGESKAVKVTVTTGGKPVDATGIHGKLVITPQAGNTTQPVLQLPIAVVVQPPVIASTPASPTLTLPQGGSGVLDLQIANRGSADLNWTLQASGRGVRDIVSQLNVTGNGRISTHFTDPSASNGRAILAADDFTVTETTELSAIDARGFMVGSGDKISDVTDITWTIYRNGNNAPQGNPETSPQLAVFRHVAKVGAPGVITSGGIQDANMTLDLAAAGQSVILEPGRYWVVVSPRISFSRRWAWLISSTGDSAVRSLTVNNNGGGNWTNLANSTLGLAFRARGRHNCGATWLGAATRTTGKVVAGSSLPTQLRVNAVGLAPGSHTGYVCVASNDPVTPTLAVRVNLTVTP